MLKLQFDWHITDSLLGPKRPKFTLKLIFSPYCAGSVPIVCEPHMMECKEKR